MTQTLANLNPKPPAFLLIKLPPATPTSSTVVFQAARREMREEVSRVRQRAEEATTLAQKESRHCQELRLVLTEEERTRCDAS